MKRATLDALGKTGFSFDFQSVSDHPNAPYANTYSMVIRRLFNTHGLAAVRRTQSILHWPKLLLDRATHLSFLFPVLLSRATG